MKTLWICFGEKDTQIISDEEGVTLRLRMPLSSGPSRDYLPCQPGQLHEHDGITFIESDDHVCGVVTQNTTPDLKMAIHSVYHRVFEVTRGKKLYRVWNYVPYINKIHQGIENYRAFSFGRSLAFEEHFGPTFHKRIPAASAVGIQDDVYAMAFVAGKAPVRYVENPEQVSAYQYPQLYGPRPPSFARGAVVDRPGERFGFVSGTAAIKGHESMHRGDPASQTELTIENIRIVLQAMKMHRHPQKREPRDCFFKTYVRYPEHVNVVKEIVHRELFSHPQRSIFLIADICRSDLLVEIEGWVREPQRIPSP